MKYLFSLALLLLTVPAFGQGMMGLTRSSAHKKAVISSINFCLVGGGKPGTSGSSSIYAGGDGGKGGQMIQTNASVDGAGYYTISIGGSNQNSTGLGYTATTGGGANGGGGAANQNNFAGNGAQGTYCSLKGFYYGAGGGGGSYGNYSAGNGGQTGGGNGWGPGVSGQNGGAGTGSGGGGGGSSGGPGTGGTGYFIANVDFKYRTPIVTGTCSMSSFGSIYTITCTNGSGSIRF